uniref:FAD-dependent urate hydroxylase HpyO/Asp monooxygenase CreE-like FAD/NAD(P)-binding domain-containing protein n=1 Tax=Cyanothece sp. (strain PCC 7425 / ATCC 29141) TaxID=395961 RepID=B8HT58_CYAP4
MTVVQLPHTIDLAIIGAGPQALTLVTHLLQKKKAMAERLLVFDPSGTWIDHWQQQFARLEIPHLRSPAVHHPDPNAFALRRFAESRPEELVPPYDLPGTRLFADFCQEVVQRWQLQNRVVKATVTKLTPLTAGPRSGFQLQLSDGREIRAHRVVLATGGGRRQLPQWVEQIPPGYPPDRLCHSTQIDLRGLHLRGERILILGGGLTSGHLAVGAIERGAAVVLMSRRQLYEKLFDADPGWLGPKYLKGFWAEPDWCKRVEMISTARNGGSMTPAMLTRLRRLSHRGQLTFYERCQVAQAAWDGQSWQIRCSTAGQHDCLQNQRLDRIWLATGSYLDAAEEPLLSQVGQYFSPIVVNGLPVLDEYLRWPGCELFIMGGLAALQVGPTARNLSGAIQASNRIVPALLKPRGIP